MITQSTLFNFAESSCRAEVGMKRALKKANKDNHDWEEKAMAKLIEFIHINSGNFFCEDVRAYAACDDNFPLPDNNRVWGPIIQKAAREGLIKRIGYGPVSNINANNTPASIWVKR